jgi:hypothetical protein
MQRNSSGQTRDTLVKRTDYALTDVANPKAKLLPDIEEQIGQLRAQKSEKENNKINIREQLETDLSTKTGFLDELKVLFSILLSSWIALVVWCMFFLFLMSLELLVLVNKFGEDKTDYDTIILHQKETRIKMVEKLS